MDYCSVVYAEVAVRESQLTDGKILAAWNSCNSRGHLLKLSWEKGRLLMILRAEFEFWMKP
jgi:hypothetical protein